MRGEVNVAIFTERRISRGFAISVEIAKDLAVARQRGDLPRFPVGRREAIQVRQGNRANGRIDGRRNAGKRFAGLLRTLTRRRSDPIVGGGEDRIGEDNDVKLSPLTQRYLPSYRRQRRSRRRDSNFVIGDQRSVMDTVTGRRRDRVMERRRDGETK